MSELAAVIRFDRLLTPEQAESFRQDYADGAALRRLREALPEGWDCGWRHRTQGDGEMYVWASVDGDPDMTEACIQGQRDFYLEHTGATIAEAADKCREALR